MQEALPIHSVHIVHGIFLNFWIFLDMLWIGFMN